MGWSDYDYVEKLKHPKWQKKRLEVLERAGWKCQGCFNTEQTLHVHHLVYSKGEPWDAPMESLESLCESCHQLREGFNDLFGRSLVPTRFCLLWKYFYKPAFDGTSQAAMNCDSFLELRNRLNEERRAKSNQSPSTTAEPVNSSEANGTPPAVLVSTSPEVTGGVP